MSDDRTPTAADDTREALAKMLDEHWFTTKRRDAGAREPGCKCGQRQAEDNHNARRHADHLADAILASPWLAAHVDAAVAEARGERDPAAWMEVALDERKTLRRVAAERDTARAEVDRLASLSASENARYRAARADRDRLVEAVRGLADRWTGRGYVPHPNKVVAELRALIAGTEEKS